MRKSLVLCLALLLPLAACGDDDPVGPDPTGSLSFNYNGDISGTFSVSGEPRLTSTGLPQNPFAVATTEGGSLLVFGARPATGNKFDLVRIEGELGAGTFQVCSAPSADCPGGIFLLGLNDALNSFDQAYVLTSGTVTVSEVNGERVRGSFQGTAVRLDPATGQRDPTRTITISNGQFDAPVDNEFDT